jgi:hypothetical protein
MRCHSPVVGFKPLFTLLIRQPALTDRGKSNDFPSLSPRAVRGTGVELGDDKPKHRRQVALAGLSSNYENSEF